MKSILYAVMSCKIFSVICSNVFNYLDFNHLERRHGRVVRAARLWCRKSPLGCEFEAGLRHGMTGKLSLSTQL